MDIVEKLLKLQKGKCPCCSLPLGDDFHLDHKMPLALGGDHVDDNMQLLKARCNMQKRASNPIDFMQSRGFLLLVDGAPVPDDGASPMAGIETPSPTDNLQGEPAV